MTLILDSLSVLLAKNQGISCLLSALTRFANHDEILATAILSLARMCAASGKFITVHARTCIKMFIYISNEFICLFIFSDACCVHIQKNDGIPELFKVLTSTSNLEVIEGAVDILGSMSAVGKSHDYVIMNVTDSTYKRYKFRIFLFGRTKQID